ncbi:MAG: putative virulence factor, partial [Bacteroidales bacterium]|nr:putative virulence factor [Bacteroidales bacterium]
MIQDIKDNIAQVNSAIEWANKYGKSSFPIEEFKSYRRKLKKISSALEENCSAAAYGESQVGKSYLMSSLLSSPGKPFVICNQGQTYNFINDLNTSGGNNNKVETTGVVTRFTINCSHPNMSNFVKIRTLSIVDIILLLTDSYYNDLKLNP